VLALLTALSGLLLLLLLAGLLLPAALLTALLVATLLLLAGALARILVWILIHLFLSNVGLRRNFNQVHPLRVNNAWLVHSFQLEPDHNIEENVFGTHARDGEFHLHNKEKPAMGRYLLLWLLGVPIPILVLIWLFGGLH